MIRVRMDFNPPVPTCDDSKRESRYRSDGGMDNYYELASDGTHNLKSCDGYAMLVSHGKKTFPVLWLLLRNEVALEVIGRLRFPVYPYWRASNVDNEMMKRSIRRCQTGVVGGYAGEPFKHKIYHVAGRCLEFILADISFAVGKGSPYDAVFAFPWSKERLVWWNTPSGTKLNFIQDHKAPTKEVFGRILQFPEVKFLKDLKHIILIQMSLPLMISKKNPQKRKRSLWKLKTLHS